MPLVRSDTEPIAAARSAEAPIATGHCTQPLVTP